MKSLASIVDLGGVIGIDVDAGPWVECGLGKLAALRQRFCIAMAQPMVVHVCCAIEGNMTVEMFVRHAHLYISHGGHPPKSSPIQICERLWFTTQRCQQILQNMNLLKSWVNLYEV